MTSGFKGYSKERGFRAWFCRKADPESKGKVENVVKCVKQNFLCNRLFRDLD
ncbi:transposase [Pedobacter steynii]|uniref:transposase n=1 Tax=Pedobacter steynii TaxID=430522 RepID=UPI00115FBA20|nr:transposase [Pedobacter steynii]NQX41248.1 transposase [Pedobacter steynii]